MRKSTVLVAIAVLVAVVLIGLPANRQSVGQFPEGFRPGPRWEYKTIRASLSAEEAGKGELNALGEERWELSAAVQPERGGQFLILKRPLAIRGTGDR